MTGQELIDWIKENNAEDYEVRTRDNYGDEVTAWPEIEQETIRRWINGKEEKVVRHYIDI